MAWLGSLTVWHMQLSAAIKIISRHVQNNSTGCCVPSDKNIDAHLQVIRVELAAGGLDCSAAILASLGIHPVMLPVDEGHGHLHACAFGQVTERSNTAALDGKHPSMMSATCMHERTAGRLCCMYVWQVRVQMNRLWPHRRGGPSSASGCRQLASSK